LQKCTAGVQQAEEGRHLCSTNKKEREGARVLLQVSRKRKRSLGGGGGQGGRTSATPNGKKETRTNKALAGGPLAKPHQEKGEGKGILSVATLREGEGGEKEEGKGVFAS